MTRVDVQLGTLGEVDAAVSVYERSNLMRRQGAWPARAARLAQVRASLHEAGSWFLLGRDDGDAVAMAQLLPFRADGGIGQVIPGAAFLNLIYVLPDRWGVGIGGMLLDAAIAEAERRGFQRMFLWTHERRNERAQRLYRGRSFAPTGRTASDDEGKPIGEWLRDGEPHGVIQEGSDHQ